MYIEYTFKELELDIDTTYHNGSQRRCMQKEK